MKIYAKAKYRNLNGIVVPSVTTALGELNKPALIGWANKMGLKGIDINKFKDHTADIGVLTHDMIICSLQGFDPDFSEYTPEQVESAIECFKKFEDWQKRNPVQSILAEHALVSERYQYGGQIDLYAICGKELVLADFKTSATGIFPEMIYQVAAYRQLLDEHGYGITKALILRLGRGTAEGADEKILTSKEMDHGFEIFMHTLAIYKLKQQENSRD